MGTEIERAVERWKAKGIVTSELAERLLAEAHADGERGRTRVFQYVISASAALVVVLAAGVFMSLAWPSLSDRVRILALVVTGATLLLAGKGIASRSGLAPVGYLVQTAGLGLLLFGYMYPDDAWSPRSFMWVVVAVASFLTPVVSTLVAISSNAVMPAVNAAFGYAFLLVGLSRLGFPWDVALWIVDAALLLTLAVLAIRLLRPAAPESRQWELSTFIASMFAGFPLAGFTGVLTFSSSSDSVWAVFAWWLIMLLVTLWAIHQAPPWLRRTWFPRILAGCALLGIPLVYWLYSESGLGSGLAPLAPGLLGGAALAYAIRFDAPDTLVAACVAIVIAAWHFGIDQGRAFGAVVALAFTAAVLFWLAARLGQQAEAHRGDPQ